MSKTQFKDRLSKIESKTPTNKPTVIIKMWCPGGIAPEYRGGKTKIEVINAGEAKVE